MYGLRVNLLPPEVVSRLRRVEDGPALDLNTAFAGSFRGDVREAHLPGILYRPIRLLKKITEGICIRASEWRNVVRSGRPIACSTCEDA